MSVWICEAWKAGKKKGTVRVFDTCRAAEKCAEDARHCGLDAAVWEM